jgi:hypothetical protein
VSAASTPPRGSATSALVGPSSEGCRHDRS